jgi:predicted transcriptional regulator
MKDFKTFKQELLKDEATRNEYEKLAPRYELISQLIEARLSRKLTQKDLAQKVGTKQSAIARLEAGNTNPSLGFLEKIAQALTMTLSVQFRK